MKKLSKINETHWGGMVKRSSGEDVRKESENNIKEMKPVDLGDDIPVYVADIDYEEGDVDHFKWDDAMKINDRIKSTGWRLPYGTEEICNIFFENNKLPHELKDYLKANKNYKEFQSSIISEKTGETLEFKLENHNGYAATIYWCDWETKQKYEDFNVDKSPNARSFTAGDSGIDYGTTISTNNENKHTLLKIRLVKDK